MAIFEYCMLYCDVVFEDIQDVYLFGFQFTYIIGFIHCERYSSQNLVDKIIVFILYLISTNYIFSVSISLLNPKLLNNSFIFL